MHLHRAEAGVKHDHFVSKGWRTVDPTKPLFHDWEVMLDRTKIVSGKEGTKIET